jgi:transposase
VLLAIQQCGFSPFATRINRLWQSLSARHLWCGLSAPGPTEAAATAAAHVPDECFEVISHHLPPAQPVWSKGGCQMKPHWVVMNVIWFVLATGCYEEVPKEMGCSGTTAQRWLRAWEELGSWDRLHADLLGLLKRAGKLDPDTAIDGVMVRAFGGGEATGRSPVDRSKKGSKHTSTVDRNGAPLAVRTAGANASDHTQIFPLVLHFPRVKGTPGRPKELPDEPDPDRGYDRDATRWILAWLGVETHVARRNTGHRSGLGKVRWVEERAISWIKGLRRLRIRYDRLRVTQEAWNTLAACVIGFRILHEEVALAGEVLSELVKQIP